MARSIRGKTEPVEENKSMSLYTDMLEPCVLLDKTTASDGYGGYITTWVDGAEFEAACIFDTSLQARVADKQGVTNLYTVHTLKSMNLQYHDVFRRVSDGKIFRVTSDGDDKKDPPASTINMRIVTAEEWELPNG